jgi:AraC-like DNA-binding protein
MIPSKPSRATLTVLGVVGRERVSVRAELPTLLLTVEAGIARVVGRGVDATIDRSSCLVLPRGQTVTVRAATAAIRIAAIGFAEPLRSAVVRAHRSVGLERAMLDRYLQRSEQLPRTVWVHELVHRYVFERHALGAQANQTTRFLEIELLKEVYFLCRDRLAGTDRATTLVKHTACVERALAHVEAHLFARCTSDALVRNAGASESTLLRAFRRELGQTPITYWRGRKLEEALMLVRSGRYTIQEVASRVGYDNPTAFGHAFRLRFGRPPSEFLPRQPRRPAP